jgi:hypothetical protein
MTKMIIAKSMQAKLSKLKKEVEFCDQSGKPLGIFYPFGKDKFSLPIGVKSPISDKEIARRRKQRGGRTLAEIWARLGRS